MGGKRSVEDRYLYKGKRVDNGEWIYGSLITGVFTRGGRDIPYILCPDKADYDCFEDFSEVNGIFEVEPETVCRCIGLPDKNGKKIFEGDIIRYSKKLFKIVWVQECAHFAAHPMEELSWSPCMNVGTVKAAEVAGNIFDDLQLLEGGV